MTSQSPGKEAAQSGRRHCTGPAVKWAGNICLVILPQARPWVNNDARERLWSKSAKSRKRPVLTPQSWLQLYLETLAIQWSTRACWIKWLKLLSISSISVFFCMRGPGKVAFDELILVPNHLKGPWLSNFCGFFNIFCFIFQPDERKKKKRQRMHRPLKIQFQPIFTLQSSSPTFYGYFSFSTPLTLDTLHWYSCCSQEWVCDECHFYISLF